VATLALGINLFLGTYTEEMTAIAFLMTIPMIVLFFLAQRYYIRGVVLGGVKG
jgi:multiple sugar transport system permease protein